MSTSIGNFHITVPAGEYYAGDPNYTVQRERWNGVLTSSEFFSHHVATLDGQQIFAADTMYGDGTYVDQEGNEYPVDSGLIGLVPVSVGLKGGTPRGVRKVLVTSPTLFGYDGGIIFLEGYFTINTEDELVEIIEDVDDGEEYYDDYENGEIA